MSIFIMFAPKKERRGKREKVERERNGETVGIHVWKARDARGTQEFTAPRARVKDRRKRKSGEKCAAEPM